MPNYKEMSHDELMKLAREEFQSLNDEEREELGDGIENKGLECITECWSLPNRLGNGAISELTRRICELDDLLREYKLDYSDEGK
jgi:hypothetical protein